MININSCNTALPLYLLQGNFFELPIKYSFASLMSLLCVFLSPAQSKSTITLSNSL